MPTITAKNGIDVDQLVATIEAIKDDSNLRDCLANPIPVETTLVVV